MLPMPRNVRERSIRTTIACLMALPICCVDLAHAGDRPPASRDAGAPIGRTAQARTLAGGHTVQGHASYYAKSLSGRRTASGERYDPDALTAAHRSLPLGTKLRVVNPKNDRSVVVTVNDRGPVPKGRMLDVSSAAADALDMKKSGVTRVDAKVVGPTPGPRP